MKRNDVVSNNDQKFSLLIKKLFQTEPYIHDPRKDMIQKHLLNGVESLSSRIKKILPFLPAQLDDLFVVDFGCGSGMATKALSEMGVKNIVGFDLDFNPVGLGLARQRQFRTPVLFFQGNGHNIPLPDNSVDFYWVGFVVEHIPSPQNIFCEMYRTLKPGGIIYVSTNNKFWPIEPHSGTVFTGWMPRKLAEKYVRWRNKWPEWEEWHVYLPSRRQLHRWALSAGFDILASTYQLVGEPYSNYFRKIPLAAWLENFLPNLYLLLRKPLRL